MHNLIVGASYSGKSNLAKYFANEAVKRNESIIVYDPLKSGGWPDQAIKFTSVEKFLKHFWSSEKCHVFVDEAKTFFNEDLRGGEKIAYQGRHKGHLIYFIGQRAASMIPPNARDMCGKVFAFKQSFDDAKILGQEYSDILKECSKLKKLEFVFSDGFSSGKAKLSFESTTSKNPPNKIVRLK